MTLHLGDLAKGLPYPVLVRLYHRHFLRKQAELAAQFSQATGLPDADTLKLSQHKSSDTVFILGSGSSINQITDAQWKVIAQHDTIGFNFWPVHSFVPRIFVFESVVESRSKPIFDALLDLLHSRADAYANTIKIVTELKRPGMKQLVTELSGSFRENLYLGYTFPVVARSEEQLASGLKFLSAKGYFEPSDQMGRLFKYGGSVIGMISLALRMNYRRIVLCGIDLGDQNYFYQDADKYPESAHWEFVPRGNIHLTARRLPWMVPAQQVIYEFKQVVLDSRGVELFVQNSSSTLYPKVPVLPEEFFLQKPIADPIASMTE